MNGPVPTMLSGAYPPESRGLCQPRLSVLSVALCGCPLNLLPTQSYPLSTLPAQCSPEPLPPWEVKSGSGSKAKDKLEE
jgi:hypothetical protein